MILDHSNYRRLALVGIATLGLIGLPLLLVGQSNALEIHNDDEKDYTVRIIEGSYSETFDIHAVSSVIDLCNEHCKVIIEGVGSIDVEVDDVYRIYRGKLVPDLN